MNTKSEPRFFTPNASKAVKPEYVLVSKNDANACFRAVAAGILFEQLPDAHGLKQLLAMFYELYPQSKPEEPYLTVQERFQSLKRQHHTLVLLDMLTVTLRQLALNYAKEHAEEFIDLLDGKNLEVLRLNETQLNSQAIDALAKALYMTINIKITQGLLTVHDRTCYGSGQRTLCLHDHDGIYRVLVSHPATVPNLMAKASVYPVCHLPKDDVLDIQYRIEQAKAIKEQSINQTYVSIKSIALDTRDFSKLIKNAYAKCAHLLPVALQDDISSSGEFLPDTDIILAKRLARGVQTGQIDEELLFDLLQTNIQKSSPAKCA